MRLAILSGKSVDVEASEHVVEFVQEREGDLGKRGPAFSCVYNRMLSETGDEPHSIPLQPGRAAHVSVEGDHSIVEGTPPMSPTSSSKYNDLDELKRISAEVGGKTTPSTLSDDAEDTTLARGRTEGRSARTGGNAKKRMAVASQEVDVPDASEEGSEGKRKPRKSARLT